MKFFIVVLFPIISKSDTNFFIKTQNNDFSSVRNFEPPEESVLSIVLTKSENDDSPIYWQKNFKRAPPILARIYKTRQILPFLIRIGMLDSLLVTPKVKTYFPSDRKIFLGLSYFMIETEGKLIRDISVEGFFAWWVVSQSFLGNIDQLMNECSEVQWLPSSVFLSNNNYPISCLDDLVWTLNPTDFKNQTPSGEEIQKFPQATKPITTITSSFSKEDVVVEVTFSGSTPTKRTLKIRWPKNNENPDGLFMLEESPQ